MYTSFLRRSRLYTNLHFCQHELAARGDVAADRRDVHVEFRRAVLEPFVLAAHLPQLFDLLIGQHAVASGARAVRRSDISETVNHVVSPRAYIQVRWIAAGGVVTAMEHAHLRGDRPVGEDVGLAAGVNRHALVGGQAVAAGLGEAEPWPTLIRAGARHFAPKSDCSTQAFFGLLRSPVLSAHLIGQGLEVGIAHAGLSPSSLTMSRITPTASSNVVISLPCQRIGPSFMTSTTGSDGP